MTNIFYLIGARLIVIYIFGLFLRHAKERGVTDTAFVRLEQLCPFPAQELQDVLKIYPNVKKFVWSQEEHRNAGAWTFVRPRQVDEFLFCIIFNCAHTQKSSVELNLLRSSRSAVCPCPPFDGVVDIPTEI